MKSWPTSCLSVCLPFCQLEIVNTDIINCTEMTMPKKRESVFALRILDGWLDGRMVYIIFPVAGTPKSKKRKQNQLNFLHC